MLLNRLTNSRELPNDGLGLDNAYIKATRAKVELLRECMVGTRDLALLEHSVGRDNRVSLWGPYSYTGPICPGTSQGGPGF